MQQVIFYFQRVCSRLGASLNIAQTTKALAVISLVLLSAYPIESSAQADATKQSPAPITTAVPVPVAPPIAPSAADTQAPPAVTTPQAPAQPEIVIEPPPFETKVTPTPQAENLWQRIRRGFKMNDLGTPLAENRTQWYAKQPDYVKRMTERSSRYLFHIVEELEQRNMPTELALLPFIESAFNPQAYSSAKAAGMWQFIPSTGKQYQLKQNIFRDDRRHVTASTGAALDYLQKLHGMFGDWHLALAAYNWGEGSVMRAQKKNEALGLPTGYVDLQMPTETQYYVPKLQAMKNIVQSPEQYNIALPEVPNHPYFEAVQVTRDIDVALVAKLADISVADFQTLNPSYKKPTILGASRPKILLPYDNAELFSRNMEKHKGALASWGAVVLANSEKPASVAKRYGISEANLRSINGIPPRMVIKAGSTLVVPRGVQRQADVSMAVADNAMLSMSPEPPPLRRASHKVRKGESLDSIAKRYHTNLAQLKGWNKGIATAKAGQSLVVYVPNKGKAARGSKFAIGSKSARGHAVARGKTKARVAAKAHKSARTKARVAAR
jgi:membrane-bound lytic murein transglycosylase D